LLRAFFYFAAEDAAEGTAAGEVVAEGTVVEGTVVEGTVVEGIVVAEGIVAEEVVAEVVVGWQQSAPSFCSPDNSPVYQEYLRVTEQSGNNGGR
jgi:hypothetical protein